jgi:uncharacterized protein YndB with AHSA1/START domain
VGEYLEIVRPRRLVFTFAVPKYSPQATRVSIDIVAAGSGCDLTLTHEGVLPEWESPTQQGWGMILGQLTTSLSGDADAYAEAVEPGTVRLERLLPGPIDRVWAYLTESDKRGTVVGSRGNGNLASEGRSTSSSTTRVCLRIQRRGPSASRLPAAAVSTLTQ